VTGRVDAVIEPELNPWDISAIIAVLRHAGGTFTDWHANHAFDSNVRRGLSSNGHLHDELIATLSA
jgi:fructose-1,6-bisphosphatase/inositol monophosphatase family enzyme